MFRFIKIGITLILVISFIHLKAQENKCITGKALEKLDKEIVLKLTLAYFKDYEVDKGGKGLYDTEKQGVINFNKFIANKDYANYPENIRAFLKNKANGWSGSGIKVFNGYFNSMQKAKQEGNVFCKEGIFRPRKIKSTKYLDSTFNALSKEAIVITEEKKEPVAPVKPETKREDKTEAKSDKQTQTKVIEITKDSNYLSEWIYWVIIGVLLVLVFVFYKIAKKTDDELYDLKRKYKRLKNDNSLEINNLKQDLNKVKKEVNDLKEKKENLKSQLSFKQKTSNTKEEQTEIKENESKSEPVVDVKKELYLPVPYTDSRINAEEGSENKFDLALYKVELDKDEKSGKLYIFENEEMFELAFNSPDKYLEKACNYSNAREKFHKSIETINAGKVVLEGDEWIIKEKLTIKFI